MRSCPLISLLLLVSSFLPAPDEAYGAYADPPVPKLSYGYDFDCGGLSSEWSTTARQTTPRDRGWFLGQFGNETVTLTLDSLPSHGGVRLSFELFVIRSWDGDGTPVVPGVLPQAGPGPDVWSVTVRPGRRLLRTTFDNHHFPPYVGHHRQSYPRNYPSGELAPQTGAAEVNTLGYTVDIPGVIPQDCDAVYQLSFAFAHSDSTLVLDFAASGLQDISDESWGLDNVVVELTPDVPDLPDFPSSPSQEDLLAHNPSPADGERNVTSPVLQWRGDSAADLHAVWVGTTPNLREDAYRGQQPKATYVIPSGLDPSTTYFWRIDEVRTDGAGQMVHLGEVWSFTTAAFKAHGPSPAPEQVWPSLEVALSWGPGMTATYHDVYFGTSPRLDAPTYRGRQQVTEYEYPGALEPGATYYWRIDEVESDGTTVYPGDVWTFKVEEAILVDDDAAQDPGPGDPSISDPREDGSALHPFDTIQEAIDHVNMGVVLVRDGVYRISKEIDFGGKRITLKSENGPLNCTIDCEGRSRAFHLRSGEGYDTIIQGFTITNGYDGMYGGGIRCYNSSPRIMDCRIYGNTAGQSGGGIFLAISNAQILGCSISGNVSLAEEGGGIGCWGNSRPMVMDTRLTNNGVSGVHLRNNDIEFLGHVVIQSNALNGAGTAILDPSANLELRNCEVACNIVGSGTIRIPLRTSVRIIEDAIVELNPEAGEPGVIECSGRLEVTDKASLLRTKVHAAGPIFRNEAKVIGNTFLRTPAGGSEAIELWDFVKFLDNTIDTSRDDYLKVDKWPFRGMLSGNYMYVTLAGGQLFEVRGLDEDDSPPYGDERDLIHKGAVPRFDLRTWTVESLVLTEGASVALTDRSTSRLGPVREALYVKKLVLGPNSTLNLAFNRVYYASLEKDPTARILNEPVLGFSVGEIDLGDAEDLDYLVANNNYIEPEAPAYDRLHLQQVTGVAPDPKGVIRMRNQEDPDPTSPTFGQIITAHAKGMFGRCNEDQVYVRFSYLFESLRPGLQIAAYLSDVPELLSHDHPLRAQHYVEIGRVPAPPAGRPGSVDSGRFGVFKEWVGTQGLDLSGGTWVELELMESGQDAATGRRPRGIRLASSGDDDESALVGGWATEVHCDGICMDLNWSDSVDEEDWVLVLGSCGYSGGISADGTGSRECLEGVFSSDGYIDLYDTHGMDASLQGLCGNLCRTLLPLVGDSAMSVPNPGSFVPAVPGGLAVAGLEAFPGELLVIGKSRYRGALSDLVTDCFCMFDASTSYMAGDPEPPLPVRGNVRLVRGPGGQVYAVNSELGIVQIDGPVKTIIPPGEASYPCEPRYESPAAVYIGLQREGASSFGRPILDAAFGNGGEVYVVPVVVQATGHDPYLAGARLRRREGANPPYDVVQLYDDPPPADDNQHRNYLREIEVDGAGNVYMLNVHRFNESCILWKYSAEAVRLERLDLLAPDSPAKVEDPLAMHASKDGRTLYLASGQRDIQRPNETVLYGLSTQDFSLDRSITISGMELVSAVTEDPETGTLWVVGFSMPFVPGSPDPTGEPFCQPYLADVRAGVGPVEAVGISDPANHDLVVPTSILWLGAAE